MENSDFKISKGKLKKYVGPGGDVVIPDGVTSIEREAFKGCKNLTSVVIPHGVTQIGTSAFEDCENLTDVSLPESVKTILGAAFKSCKKITNIHIPSSVTFIDGIFLIALRSWGRGHLNVVITLEKFVFLNISDGFPLCFMDVPNSPLFPSKVLKKWRKGFSAFRIR